MQGLLILSLALVLTLLVTLVPGLSEWRQALTRHRQAAILPLLALAGTMLGSTQAASLAPGLPDPLRMVRAALFVFMFLAAALTLVSSSRVLRTSGKGMLGMFMFGLLAIASALWSIGPFISVWKGFEVLTLVLALMTVTPSLREDNDAIWLTHLLALALLYLCMTVVAGLVLFPGLAIKNPDTTYTQYYFAVRGLVPVMNPATVGSIAALLFVISVSTLLRNAGKAETKRIGTYLATGITVVIMVLAHSRTSIFACMLALILMLIYARRWKLIFIVGTAGTALLLATSLESIIQGYILRGQTTEAFTSLTGRLGFWEGVWLKIRESMLIGHGYYAAQRLTFNTNSVDNTYLEVIIGLGFTGLLVFIYPLLWAAVAIYTNRPKTGSIGNHQAIWLITAGCYSVLIVRSMTGASFQVMHPLLVIYLITLALAAFLVRTSSKPAFTGTKNQEMGASPTHSKPMNSDKLLSRKKPARLLYSTGKTNTNSKNG